MNFQAMHKQRKFILIAAIVGIISIFLPWKTVSAGLFGASMSNGINGFHGAGILAFFSFGAALAISLIEEHTEPLNKTTWLVALSAGIISLICGVVNIVNTNGDSMGFVEVGVGFGCWIALVASIGIIGVAWIFRSPGQNLNESFASLKKNISSLNTPTATSADTQAKSGVNKIEEIEKLIRLKEAGQISELEYQEMKSKLLK